MVIHRSSEGLDLLLELRRGAGPLHRQVEDGLRAGILAGRLAPGTVLPATRALAAELGVSRSVVTEAYAQLAAEGWLETAERRLPRVARAASAASSAAPAVRASEPLVHHDLRPGAPALDLFPRADWGRSLRAVLATLPDRELGYPPPEGVPDLRRALGAYLGRTRGVIPTDPDGPIVVAGVAQALAMIGRALEGPIAVEDPGPSDAHPMLGTEVLPVPVDNEGIVVDAIPAAARAVLVTPAHQFPTGVVLAPRRRAALVEWSRRADAFVLEDDYDAEFRYDRTPVGAVQALAPDRVVTMGSVSKTLAPALRLGWVVAPVALRERLRAARSALDHGQGALDQHALSDLLARGGYDRHLRRARRLYRERRNALLGALARELPDARPGGVAAGLHLTLELPGGDEATVVAAATARGVAVDGIGRHRLATIGPPTLLLGYGRIDVAAIPAAAGALAAACHWELQRAGR